MNLPDINILIHAHDEHSARHDAARHWWNGVLSGGEPIGLPWVVILGFVRLTTNRSVFANPWSVDAALAVVAGWLRHSNVRILDPTPGHFELLSRLLRAVGTGGNLTTDAHLAALAIEHGYTLCSTDSDFARFPDLSWKNPLAGS
jgi:uncharacterized protein